MNAIYDLNDTGVKFKKYCSIDECIFIRISLSYTKRNVADKIELKCSDDFFHRKILATK